MDTDGFLRRFSIDATTANSFRVISSDVGHPDCPVGINGSRGEIVPQGNGLYPTFHLAQQHLSWEHVPSPFTSLFSQYERALTKARQLEEKGLENVYIAVIDTYTVPSGEILDAYHIATAAGFTDDYFNPRRQLRNHRHEVLFHGVIGHDRILAIIPAMGTPVRLDIHLGVLQVPMSYLKSLGTERVEDVDQDLQTQIYQRRKVRDPVLALQTLQALCTRRCD